MACMGEAVFVTPEAPMNVDEDRMYGPNREPSRWSRSNAGTAGVSCNGQSQFAELLRSVSVVEFRVGGRRGKGEDVFRHAVEL